jgi:outer membrane protein assembly factor BamB
MNKKRSRVVWTLLATAILCPWLIILLLVLQFRLSGSSILSPLFQSLFPQGATAYPPELLDGNEDRLADLTIAGLPLSPAWEYQAPGPIDRPPLYHTDLVILKGSFEFWAIDANSGTEKWRHWPDYSEWRIYAPFSDDFLVVDGVLVFQTYPWPNSLHAIDLETGQHRWETPSAVRDLASDHKARVFAMAENSYQALDAASGQVIWISDMRPMERGGPIWYDSSAEELYVWEFSRALVVLESKTGEVIRKLGLTLYEGSPLAANSGVLFVKRGRESLLAIDGRDNQLLWAKSYSHSFAGVMFDPMIYEGILYIRTSEEALLAIDVYTGDVQWKYPSGPDAVTSVRLLSNFVVLNGIFYGIFSDARLRGFDPVTGQELGHIQFVDVSDVSNGVTVPGLAASEDMLFVSLGKTKLYAFKAVH